MYCHSNRQQSESGQTRRRRRTTKTEPCRSAQLGLNASHLRDASMRLRSTSI